MSLYRRELRLSNFVFGCSFALLDVFRKQRRVAYFQAPDRLPVRRLKQIQHVAACGPVALGKCPVFLCCLNPQGQHASRLQWPVQRTLNAEGASAQDVGVDHGRGDILVSQELLDGADVRARFEQVRGERVSQGVRTDTFRDAGSNRGPAHRPLDDGFVQVVTPAFAGGLIDVASGRREDPLPGPLARRRRIFLAQGIRQLDAAGIAAGQVLLMLDMNGLQMLAQRALQRCGQQRDPILVAP